MNPHKDTHIIIPLTWPPTHTHAHSHTLIEEGLQYEHANVVGSGSCYREKLFCSILIAQGQNEYWAVLWLQLCSSTATFCSHPTANALPFSVLSLSNYIFFLSIFSYVQIRHAGEAVPTRSGRPLFSGLPCDHVLIGSHFKNSYILMEQGRLATWDNFSSDASCNRRIHNMTEYYSADWAATWSNLHR